MKVAIVHEWLMSMRGGSKVVGSLLDLYPDADVFTLFHERGTASTAIEARVRGLSPLAALPGANRVYRHLLPLFPWAVSRIDLSGYDLVISSSHCVAKGARVGPHVPHVCYCHTPMRYIWDQFDAYFGAGRASLPVRAAMGIAAPRLRAWDVRTAAHVDHFIANSTHVRRRIKRYYGRDAAVVHPPVNLSRFAPTTGPREDFYLTLGALVPYKRVDLAVEAFNRMGKRLIVVGAGGEEASLRAAAGDTVEVRGHADDDDVVGLLSRCRALVMPGVEDFGIGVVEALASGAPVIALGVGGVEDTVRPAGPDNGAQRAPTGVFFERPVVEDLLAAVERFEALDFDPRYVASTAEGFGEARFRSEMEEQIAAVLGAWPRRLDGTPVVRGT